jgi:hypothetical protein
MYPWELEDSIWKSKANFMTWMRGGLRRSLWNRHPEKIAKIKEERFKIPNPNPRGRKQEVWACKCSVCRNTFVQKDCEVDHLLPAGALNEVRDIQHFVERLALVTRKDMRIVCKACHKLISLAERRGISIAEARVAKKLIEFKKLRKDAKQAILIDKGLPTDGTVNDLDTRYEYHLTSEANAGR